MTMVMALVVAMAYSLVATRFEPYTTPMRVATAVPCILLVALAVVRRWHHRRLPAGSGDEPGSRWLLAVWVVLMGAAVAFQLVLYLSSPRSAYPTLSSLAGIAFGWPGARPLAFAAWLLLGWYLVDR